MVNKNKRKGSDWERQAVDILNTNIKRSKFKRIPGSGAMGTSLNEPLLTSDIVGHVDSFEQTFKIECKTGYGGATQLVLKKEWLDKVGEEAMASYSIPLLMGKFLGARDGIKAFVAMDLGTFCNLINKVTALHEEVIEYERGKVESN
jgi:hypothetical protein